MARAAETFNTLFGVFSHGTVSVEEAGNTISPPKLFELYMHKDRRRTFSMVDRCKATGFDARAVTVNSMAGGNRERDPFTGFDSPLRLTLPSMARFVTKPRRLLSAPA